MESKALEQYLHKLKRALACSQPDRERLLSQGKELLGNFLGENPGGGYETLVTAFGPPEVFAGEMLSTLDQEELTRTQTRRKWLRRGVAAVVIAALVLCAVFWFGKYLRAAQVVRAGGFTTVTDDPIEMSPEEYNNLFGIGYTQEGESNP